MTWADLFERAEGYEVSVDDVRRALDERREKPNEGDETENGDDV